MCLALFASSALAAPAPQLGQDTSALVDTILSQLDGPIDAAIQAALGGETKTADAPAARTIPRAVGPPVRPPTLTNFQGTFSQVNQAERIGDKFLSFDYLLCRAQP